MFEHFIQKFKDILIRMFVLEHVDTDINKICDNKYMTLKKRIWKIKNEKTEEIPRIISSPSEQLKHIVEKMNNCLCKLLSQQNEYVIKQEELYISLYYNFPLEDDSWQQTDRFSPERGLGVKNLLTKETLFARILKSRENFLFYNSKEQARIEGCYIQDEDDRISEEGKIKGSIACYRIIVKECEQILVQAVLSISTYDKQFINKDDKGTIKNSIFNIDEYILKPFIKRINIELCLLYLDKLYEEKNKVKS